MAKEVIMPKAGMDMREGMILKWFAEVGQEVSAGDALLEIETDKVTMEIEAPADGVLLSRYFNEGDVVPVVTVIAFIGKQGEQVPDAPSAAVLPAQRETAPSAAQAAEVQKTVMPAYAYDAAIIGGGSAGYVAAIRVAQLGGKAILFERETLGGTCLNRGCIPTKTYLKTAAYLRHIRRAPERGIVANFAQLNVDMEGVHSYKQGVVKKLTSGIASLLKSRGVKVVSGTARLADAHTVICGEESYKAASVILCGGSKPGKIDIPGIESKRVITSDEILELTTVPPRLAVIGGGIIGCELAIAFSAFGSEVTIIEMMDRLVPMMDSDISAAIAQSMKSAGVRVLCGKRIEALEDVSGGIKIIIPGGGAVEADQALLSIGRAADIECMGSLNNEIKTESGRIIVNSHCQTNVKNVFACGDITNASVLAHSASKMGETAAAVIMGREEEADLSKVPSCLYTIPEAASVGMTEDEARKSGEVIIGRFPFSASGRAIASGEREGFVKVIVDKQFGEILGVHIVGDSATEIIASAKVLMDLEATIYEAAEIMSAHPTYSEAIFEACNDALGKCVHLP